MLKHTLMHDSDVQVSHVRMMFWLQFFLNESARVFCPFESGEERRGEQERVRCGVLASV